MKLFIPHTLWYEDKDGNFVGTLNERGEPPTDPQIQYQISQFPRDLRTSYLRLNEDGSSTQVMTGTASWSEDLVLAMATKPRETSPGVVEGPYKLSEAILIAAHACERCMNALAQRYGLDWGYPEFSEGWVESGTECQFCKDDPECQAHTRARTRVDIVTPTEEPVGT